MWIFVPCNPRPGAPLGASSAMERDESADAEAAKAAKEAWKKAQRAAFASQAVRRMRTAKTDAAKPIAAAVLKWGLEALLLDAEGLSAFRTFCESQVADENLSFLVEAREWRNAWSATDADTRAAHAKQLVATFLIDDAPRQVSLPSGLGDFSEIQQDMFDKAIKEARKSLIFDQFPSFELTPECDPVRKRVEKEAAAAKAAAAKAAAAAAAAKASAPKPLPRTQGDNVDANTGSESGPCKQQ